MIALPKSAFSRIILVGFAILTLRLATHLAHAAAFSFFFEPLMGISALSVSFLSAVPQQTFFLIGASFVLGLLLRDKSARRRFFFIMCAASLVVWLFLYLAITAFFHLRPEALHFVNSTLGGSLMAIVAFIYGCSLAVVLDKPLKAPWAGLALGVGSLATQLLLLGLMRQGYHFDSPRANVALLAVLNTAPFAFISPLILLLLDREDPAPRPSNSAEVSSPVS